MSRIWVLVICVTGPLAILWLWHKGWSSNRAFRVMPTLATFLWIAWGLWEQFVVQPGDNIRVDLVLFLPILLTAMIAAYGVVIRELKMRR